MSTPASSTIVPASRSSAYRAAPASAYDRRVRWIALVALACRSEDAVPAFEQEPRAEVLWAHVAEGHGPIEVRAGGALVTLAFGDGATSHGGDVAFEAREGSASVRGRLRGEPLVIFAPGPRAVPIRIERAELDASHALVSFASALEEIAFCRDGVLEPPSVERPMPAARPITFTARERTCTGRTLARGTFAPAGGSRAILIAARHFLLACEWGPDGTFASCRRLP